MQNFGLLFETTTIIFQIGHNILTPLGKVLILIPEDWPGRGGWSGRWVHPVCQLVQHLQEGVPVGAPDECLILLRLQVLAPAGSSVSLILSPSGLLFLLHLVSPASAGSLVGIPVTRA